MNLVDIITENLSVQPEEVVWVLAALVGLFYDFTNMRVASRVHRAVLASGKNGQRLQWTSFSKLLVASLGTIKLVFVMVGVMAMFRRPSPDVSDFGRLSTLVLLVGASWLLTLVSVRWRQVHDSMTRSGDKRRAFQDRRAKRQMAVQVEQDSRSEEQDDREVEQNVREEEQNVRERGGETNEHQS